MLRVRGVSDIVAVSLSALVWALMAVGAAQIAMTVVQDCYIFAAIVGKAAGAVEKLLFRRAIRGRAMADAGRNTPILFRVANQPGRSCGAQ